MKSNIEKVYSKLPQKKHNLGKHKVELQTLISRIRELTEIVSDETKILDNKIGEIYDLCFEAIGKSADLDNIYDNLVNSTKELEEKNTQFQDMIDQIGVGGNTFDESINAIMQINSAVSLNEEYETASQIVDLLKNKL